MWNFLSPFLSININLWEYLTLKFHCNQLYFELFLKCRVKSLEQSRQFVCFACMHTGAFRQGKPPQSQFWRPWTLSFFLKANSSQKWTKTCFFFLLRYSAKIGTQQQNFRCYCSPKLYSHSNRLFPSQILWNLLVASLQSTAPIAFFSPFFVCLLVDHPFMLLCPLCNSVCGYIYPSDCEKLAWLLKLLAILMLFVMKLVDYFGAFI